VATLFLAGIGFVTSIAAAFVAYLYGGYARDNWASADEIAEMRGSRELLANGSNAVARIDDCTRPIAPIFKIFMALAIMSATIRLAFVVWSTILI
jgi:hypothetical protein